MPSPVIQIRIPEDELRAVRDEAKKRGIAPSLLMRHIVKDALSGPGSGSAGRIAASRDAVQRANKVKDVVQPVLQEKPLAKLFARRQKAEPPMSLSERMRQMRESAAK